MIKLTRTVTDKRTDKYTQPSYTSTESHSRRLRDYETDTECKFLLVKAMIHYRSRSLHDYITYDQMRIEQVCNLHYTISRLAVTPWSVVSIATDRKLHHVDVWP